MKWHRGQQLWLALASVIPGWLVYKHLLQPPYAALMLVGLYFLSKRHAFLVQRQYEREDHARKVSEAEEKQRLASLPMRKRRAAERAKKRAEEGNNAGSDGGGVTSEGSDPKDE